MKESKLQAEIIKYLKHKGCYVAKMQAGPGVPVGTADIFFCLEGFFAFIEVKTSKTSKLQPLQAEFIKKMDEWSWAKIVYKENWTEVRRELDEML